VLAFMPEEECERYSAMTGQALFYMGETSLQHKILSIAEEEGAKSAAYALKLLQSEHELKKAAPGKDPNTGRIVTQPYSVKGPAMIFLTTTSLDIDDELLNRALVLPVDEGRAQTQAIHRRQRSRETLAGLLRDREKAAITRLHQNAQRLLAKVHVVNEHAESLSFSDSMTRARRDQMKYLALIRGVAVLRQHQKQPKTVETSLGEVLEYVEVEPTDIEVVNKLMREVLRRSVSELPAHTERLLSKIEGYVSARAAELKVPRSEVRFTRREIREATGLGNTQLKHHLRRLEDLEHIVARGGRGYRIEYELVTSGTEASWMLPSGGTSAGAKTVGAEGEMVGGNGGHGREMVGPRSPDGRGLVGVDDTSTTNDFGRENKPRETFDRPARPQVARKHVNGALNGASHPVLTEVRDGRG
jgi:hypothetical protein